VNAQEIITERDFQATVIDMARTYGWIVGFTHDSRKSEPGEPDLRMIRPPRVIFAELKTVKGRISKGRWNKSGRWLPGQDEWGEALASCPWVEYYLWRPTDNIEAILR
jgi:hypothetical protein